MNPFPTGRRSFARWALALICLLAAAAAAGCEHEGRYDRTAIRVAGGDPGRGPELIREYGCTRCHVIPGVRARKAWTGPPLTAWSRRIYIAGTLPNTPDNLVAWLYDPVAVHSHTAMPRVGLSEAEARHVAAYLYTLR